jgi:uncharacterized protein (TIGR02284 family)
MKEQEMTTVLEQLNSFLRGEISAVETYRQALDSIADIRARTLLQQCNQSHQRRVDLLRTRIVELGGQPSEGSGSWGTVAKAAEGSATLFGERAAIDVLEEGEDHGLKEYRSHMEALDEDARVFVAREILPAQVQTHGAVSNLKHTLH